MKKFFAIALAAQLAGACGYMDNGRYSAERSEKSYRQAMDDYAAGRIDAALANFESAVKSNPGNASARFQTAVLLQDAKNDYLGAICFYRGFLAVAPDSDKAVIARERMAYCEKLLRSEIAKAEAAESVAGVELKDAKDALEKANAENASLSKRLAETEGKLSTAERELEKLRSILKRIGDEDEDAAPAKPAAAAQTNEPDDASAPRQPVKIANVEETEDEVKPNPEAIALFEEEEREEAAAQSNEPTALPADRERSAVKLTDIGRRFGDPKPQDAGREALSNETVRENGMRTYVVQEGETLSSIALKFYGRKKAWPRIQDANRTTISSDGSVKAGQTIVIP